MATALTLSSPPYLADKVIEAIRELEIEPKPLILQGMMKGDKERIEGALKSKVMVGPMDSAQLPMLIRKSLPNLWTV